MKEISLRDYQQIFNKSNVLEQDSYGPKVLKTGDGLMVKLFRRKRFLTSAIFRPYSVRFLENAKRLKSLGFDTVDVVDIYKCKPIKRSLVIYRPLPGETLRTELSKKALNDELVEMFVKLLALLHERGVLFRSCHFNNIIVPESMDSLGLIDISDVKIWPKPLTVKKRLRNFRHLTRYETDRESIRAFGANKFIDCYLGLCSLSESHKKEFQNVLNREIVKPT